LVTVNLGVEAEPLFVVTTIVPERAPAGIVTVIDVEDIADGSGVIFTPFNFTLSTELNPVPLMVTGVPTVPVVTDKPPVELIRGNTDALGV